MLTKLPKLKDSINQVDELCSVIFATAFCLLMIYLYMTLSLTLYMFVFNFLVAFVSKQILYTPLVLIAALLIFQGVLSFVANSKFFRSNIDGSTFLLQHSLHLVQCQQYQYRLP